ncbi:spore germination protein [Fictibacillus phosphorivorans]|uniref:spore germination protein n=1 Tax=Fictibacillus phosphorivorans TaxID=1221500 RepID=UPI002041F183|nr:spore germination protein [Fictibacillus phosphorivorans]MCM3717793.1 spore germination protein [Fictibacillus phosphorivorans]MCM3777021.1 spore germination protein [Fictibacillus phosphorivorans]
MAESHDEFLSSDLTENLKIIDEKMKLTADLKRRKLMFHDKTLFILYLDTITDKESIELHIINPINKQESDSIEKTLGAIQFSIMTTFKDISTSLAEGNSILLTENSNIAYSITTSADENRSVEESVNEKVTMGAHDSFVESAATNISLLRKRLRTPDFKVEYHTYGPETNVQVAICYLDSKVNPNVLQSIKSRLDKIKDNDLLNSRQIQETLEDFPYSPFPQSLRTERPDRAVFNLLNGNTVIFLNHEPSALVTPISFYSFLRSPEDYNSRWFVNFFYYCLRLLAFILSVTLPAFYIAVNAYHSSILPVSTFYTLKLSVLNVPFHPFVEAIMMQIVLELLKEASVRLPSAVAQTIGTVGAIVIGSAIVQTNFISNTMVVVIAITAVSSFIIPNGEMSTSMRLMSFPLIFLAAMFGFIGIAFGLMVYTTHLVKLTSAGKAYVEAPNIIQSFFSRKNGKGQDANALE